MTRHVSWGKVNLNFSAQFCLLQWLCLCQVVAEDTWALLPVFCTRHGNQAEAVG